MKLIKVTRGSIIDVAEVLDKPLKVVTIKSLKMINCKKMSTVPGGNFSGNNFLGAIFRGAFFPGAKDIKARLSNLDLCNLNMKVNIRSEYTHTYVCVLGGKKCSFFGKFGVLCFLERPVLRLALLPYYRRSSGSHGSNKLTL